MIVATLFAFALVSSGCYVNQNDLWSSDRLATTSPTKLVPTLKDIAYGPDVKHRLDVYLPARHAIGTIIWLHSGGWCCGDRTSVDPLILDTISMGYAIVSVDYRTTTTSHLDAIASDVDRAIRYVKSRRVAWGLEAGKLLIGGGSAGGHLALLATTAPGMFAAKDLPADLRAIDPHVDAAISFVGPTDLHPYIDATIPPSGLDGPYLAEQLLGCSNRATVDPATHKPFPRCTELQIQRASPLDWSRVDRYVGASLPPVYLGYGMLDTLVPPSSQAEPIAYEWQFCAGFLATYLDLPARGGHNLSFDLNRTAFRFWLTSIVAP